MPKRAIITLLTAISILALAAACQDAPRDEAGAAQAPSGEEEEARIMESENDNPLQQALATARRDFARRQEVAEDEIETLDARRVTWRNGALGCPEEGAMYTQALVEGVYILLRAGDTQQAYHGSARRDPFPCPAERSQPPAGDDDRPKK